MALSSAKDQPEFSARTRQIWWDDIRARSSSRPWSVFIVGGGVVGAGILREFVLRGIPDCLLVEKNDFASGTSGASSKLIHAGIRYLENVWIQLKKGNVAAALRHFRYVAGASYERKILGRTAPGLVSPKSILLVLDKTDPRSRLSLWAGTWVYYFLQLFQGQWFPPPRFFLSHSRMRAQAPDLDVDRAKGLFRFWDSETDDARLVIDTLRAAGREGGKALNYVSCVSWKRVEDGVEALLRNHENGETATIRARLLVNAGGPYVDEVRAMGNPEAFPPLVDRVAGSHLDVFPALSPSSFYVTAADNRLVFVLRREDDGILYSRIGTTERPLAAGESLERLSATREEITYLEDLARRFFPLGKVNAETTLRTDSGIRPLRSQAGLTAFQKSREHDIVMDGAVVHVVGVKLTDFRKVAEELFGLLPWKKIGITPATSERSSRRVALREPGPPYPEVNAAEMARVTMALHWDDFVERRRGLAPRYWRRFDPARFEAWFAGMAEALHWDLDQQEKERRRVS